MGFVKQKQKGIEKEKTIAQKQQYLLKTVLLEVAVVDIVGLYFLLNYCAYSAAHPRYAFNDTLNGTLLVMLKNPFYFLPINYSVNSALGIIILIDLFIFLYYTYAKIRVHNNVNTLKGRTEWADNQEITKKYAEFDGKDFKNAYNNCILSENIYESLDAKKHFHALNTLLIGTTGSGKTRYILKPNMLQMNANYVVTDPKGGTVTEIGESLRRHGYVIKILDIATFTNCDTYNPLCYCDRESDVKKIVEAFIKNTDKSGGKSSGKDPFWDDSMNAFLCSMISLLTLIPEGCDKPYTQMPEIMGDMLYAPTFANVTELTRMANKKWTPGCGIPKKSALGDGKNNTANASIVAAIYENIRAFEAERQDTSPEAIVKPYTLREWENFCLAPEKTSTTILMTAAVRLDPFNIEQVKRLTSSDTLDLHNFGNEKCALFLIIPANDRTYNFLAAFVYTQLFDQLYHRCESALAGTSDIYLQNKDHIKHFSVKDVLTGKDKEFYNRLKKEKLDIKKITVNGQVSKDIDDAYFDIYMGDEWIGRRPTKELADKFVIDLKNSRLKPAVKSGFQKLPIPMRFLIDEFPNIGEIPDFKDKLSTVRQYDISCMVICQTITQLKGMYPDDYETIDGNCPQVIFLGGDENSNNEYLSKKMGEATKKGINSSVDNKRVNDSIQTEGGALMRPEDFGRIDYNQTILFMYGEQPIMDTKYDYPSHRNYKYTYDYANDEHVEAYIFDRSALNANQNALSQLKKIKPKAVPQVLMYNSNIFKQIMCRFTDDEAYDAFNDATEDFLNDTSLFDDEDFM
jgi:type IV secretory pathway TraG/TraD family ATPase VirD4